jgi:hypothetical protein
MASTKLWSEIFIYIFLYCIIVIKVYNFKDVFQIHKISS